MGEYLIQSETLTAIGNEIRTISGTSNTMSPSVMADHIEAANTEINTQTELIEQIIIALENQLSSSNISINTATVTPSSNSRSISFTGLSEEPKMFSIVPTANTTLNSNTRYALNVSYDGSSTVGIYSTTSTASYTSNGFTFTYSNGTLTINTASTSNGGYFRSGVTYKLTYVVGGSSSGDSSGSGSSGGSSGVTVQRTTGTFTTNSSGAATATCGFQPDLIYIYLTTYNGIEEGLSIPFGEQTNTSQQYCALGYWDNGIYEITASKTSTGFSVTVYDLGWGSAHNLVKSKTFSYTAVKYT